MRTKPLLFGLIVAVVGGILVYLDTFSWYISWGVAALGILILLAGLFMKPKSTETTEQEMYSMPQQ